MREGKWNGWIDGWTQEKKETGKGKREYRMQESWNRERKETKGSRTEGRNET